jgi:hypothetical protein
MAFTDILLVFFVSRQYVCRNCAELMSRRLHASSRTQHCAVHVLFTYVAGSSIYKDSCALYFSLCIIV